MALNRGLQATFSATRMWLNAEHNHRLDRLVDMEGKPAPEIVGDRRKVIGETLPLLWDGLREDIAESKDAKSITYALKLHIGQKALLLAYESQYAYALTRVGLDLNAVQSVEAVQSLTDSYLHLIAGGHKLPKTDLLKGSIDEAVAAYRPGTNTGERSEPLLQTMVGLAIKLVYDHRKAGRPFLPEPGHDLGEITPWNELQDYRLLPPRNT